MPKYCIQQNIVDVYHFGREQSPDWFKGKIRNLRMSDNMMNSSATIDSANGISLVRNGDYIIRDKDGNLFVFEPYIFLHFCKPIEEKYND